MHAYDPSTLGLIGSLSITNVLGTPRSLVRWGPDGLAFCTSSNQVIVLRTLLLPSGPASDLAIGQSVFPAPALSGSNVTFCITITNSGDRAAGDVVLTDRIPTDVTFVSVVASQGSCATMGSWVNCSIGMLANGARATMALTVRPTTTGMVQNIASITSSTPDPNLSNNVNVSLVQSALDEDYDGIADDWERAHGLAPTNPDDALDDPDGDGASNLAEYLAGTDPQDSLNVLRLVAVRLIADSVEVTFNSTIGKCYSLESTPEFDTDSWNTIASGIIGNGSLLRVSVPRMSAGLRQFIRVRLQSDLRTP